LKVRFLSPANDELDEAIRYYDHQISYHQQSFAGKRYFPRRGLGQALLVVADL